VIHIASMALDAPPGDPDYRALDGDDPGGPPYAEYHPG